MKTYKMTIAGLERELPVCPLNEHISIAGFVIFGDVELTVAAATELLKKAPEFDIIATAEAKGIPLAFEMARQSGKPYRIARKVPKLYMADPVTVNVRSITTAKMQTLILDRSELESLRDKRVLVVDDVISTGESVAALEKLLEQVPCEIVGRTCILAEGDAIKRNDVIYLEPLPLFRDGVPVFD